MNRSGKVMPLKGNINIPALPVGKVHSKRGGNDCCVQCATEDHLGGGNFPKYSNAAGLIHGNLRANDGADTG